VESGDLHWQIGVGDSKFVVYFDPLLLQVQKIELLRDCKRTPSETKGALFYSTVDFTDASDLHQSVQV